MTVAVGLSGGVDSAVAALLLREQGHRVVGITMKLWRGAYRGGTKDACFGPGEADDIARAEAIARHLGIPYHVFDLSEAYERAIVGYFRDSCLKGETPNPCVRCNAAFKFGLLPRLAREAGLEFDRFATGHYARLACTNGRQQLLRALDTRKDQSYFLYRLSQEQLARHCFPLGMLQKKEVRALARRAGLAVAEKPDSQDFYAGDTEELLQVPPRRGAIVDRAGHVLGHHDGFWRYTIGQRKGLGIGGAGAPFYVLATNPCRNEVVVGRREEACAAAFALDEIHWVSCPKTEAPLRCRVRVRSAGPLVPACLEAGACRVDEPLFGVTPGQSAVCYGADDECVLCGGIIRPFRPESFHNTLNPGS